MTSAMPELGSKISLISKADIRYEGRLFTVDPQECTIALANVRSFGTEDRDTQFPVVPQNQVYEYILFRGSDIKDIRVVNNVHSIPNDPAIVQMTVQQAPIGQPTYQMIPTSNYPHPMMAGMAGPASSIPGFPGAYPMSMGGGGGGHNMMANNARPQNQHIMNNNQINKAPSELNPASGETNMNNITNIMPMTNVKPQMTKPVEQTMEDGVLDLISGGGGGGGSRSNTPTPSLITRKSPSSIDQATQAGHQQRVGKIGEKTANRDAHQNQHQQHGPRVRSGSALSQYSDTKRGSGNHHHHDDNQMDNYAHRGMHNAAPGGNNNNNQQQQHQRGGDQNSESSSTNVEQLVSIPEYNDDYICPCCLGHMPPDSARAHLNDYHNKSLSCKICFRYFESKSLLNKHENNHRISTRRIRYCCVYCDSKFFEKAVLFEHVYKRHRKRVDAAWLVTRWIKK